MDMKRYPRLDALCNDVGIVPDTEDSGDTKKEKGLPIAAITICDRP
jgi:hypothetical protein